MPLPRPAPLVALSQGGLHRFTTCWKLTRSDGTILRLTEHDHDLVIEGDGTYSPMASINASARQKQQGTRPQNTDIKGVIDSDFITLSDLRSGKYREASLLEFTVDWRFPWQGVFVRREWWFDDLNFSGEDWVANIVGLLGRLRRKVGRVYSRSCDVKQFGDSRCKFNIAAVTLTGRTVSAIVESRRVFTTNLTAGLGYYNLGKLIWTTGANTGEVCEVKNYIHAGGRIALQLRTPFDIAAADQFTISPGCQHTREACKSFNNIANYRGFPDIPGNNILIRVPGQQSG